MNPRVKNIIDWFSIAIGALTILSNLIVPDSCRLGCMNKALLILSTVLAVMYLFYAGWLYCFKRADFDWHLINGHFLRKVCAIVVLFPSLLTCVGNRIIDNPDDLYFGSIPAVESDDSTAVQPVSAAEPFLDGQHSSKELRPSIFWSTYLHYINPGNPHTSSTVGGRLWAVIIGIFGIFLMGGLMVSSIVGWFSDRKRMWADGTIRYKLRFLGRNRFAVVIGANEIAASVIRNLFSAKRKNEVNYKSEGCNDYVILQTNRKVEDVRAELKSHLTSDELKRVIIYNALRDSEDEIENLYLEHVTEIYVLGESTLIDGGETYHDALNMACVNLIAKHLEITRPERKSRRDVSKERDKKIKGLFKKCKLEKLYGRFISFSKMQMPFRKVCKVMFDYQTTSSIFQFSDLSTEVKDNLVFIPFNRYESWARKVMVDCTDGTYDYMPLDGPGFTSDSHEFVHFVIVGMSKMGIAMGVEALLQAHYLNSAVTPTRITFIDTNADKEMEFFKGRYSNMFELIRTRFIDTTVPCSPKTPVYSGDWKDPVAEYASKWAHLTENGKNFLDVEIEFIKGGIESENVRKCLTEITSNKLARVTISICLTFTHQAIAAALYMPMDIYMSDRLQQVWVYQSESAAILSNLIQQKKDVRYCKIRPFGMLYGEYMSDRTLYLKALLVNVAYDIMEGYNVKGWPATLLDREDPGYVEARRRWKSLSVDKTWSNKYFADSIPVKIRNLFVGKPEYSTWGAVMQLLKNNIDATLNKFETALTENKHALELCEHNRWNIQQLILGYHPCNAEFDAIFEQINSAGEELPEIKKKYLELKEKYIHINTIGTIVENGEVVDKKIKDDIKECFLRYHPNICAFEHLDVVDSGAKEYDEILNNAIPKIISLVEGSVIKK